MKIWTIFAAAIMDMLNPQRCCCCEELVSHVHNGICDNCLGHITNISGFVNVIRKDVSDVYSMDNRKWYLDECVPLQVYYGEMKKVIQSIKYDRRVSLISVMSKLVKKLIDEKKWAFDCIVPVPMKRENRIKRGFNQAELLTKQVSRLSGIPCRDILKEKGHAKTQKSLQIHERFVNVLGRFALKSKNVTISGMRILLIDDVYTTGATLNECARILKKNGASYVLAVTLAGTPRKKD